MEEKMGPEKVAAAAIAIASNQSRLGRFCKPSWILRIISDLDERMKMVALNLPEEDYADTFAKRAEAYYRKRPQLLALLQDLYNGYISLADRYCQNIAKQQKQKLKIPSINFEELDYDYDEEEDEEDDHSGSSCLIQGESDAESSLSYQCPFPTRNQRNNVDNVVAELVMMSVDYHIIVEELGIVEQRQSESLTKIELQKKLLEVLESERLMLMNENGRLGYRVTALVEENKGLASESLFIKRKAGELARCVLKMREDRRVCMLSRKIEDLQGQIYGLEKRNKEYYEQLVLVKKEYVHLQEQHDEGDQSKNKKKKKTNRSKIGGELTLDSCSPVDEVAAVANLMRGAKGGGRVKKRGGSKWWNRIKNFDLFLPCGPHNNFTC